MSTNVESDTNIAYKLIVATALSLFISATSVFLRLICRRLKNVPLLTDDYLAVSSLVFMTAIATASLLLIGSGLGSHSSTVTMGQLVTYNQLSYAIYLLYVPTVTFAKLSILFFYRRILPLSQILLATTTIISILIAWSVAAVCTSIFRCSPQYETWQPAISSKCVDRHAYTLLLQIPSIVIDVAIVVLPLKSVWDSVLKMPQKIMATGFLMAGIMTLIGDIVKLAVMIRSDGSTDATYSQVDIFVWTNLNPALAILAASIPVLRPLIQSTRKLGSKRSSETAGILHSNVERALTTVPEPLSSTETSSQPNISLPCRPQVVYTREERAISILGGDAEKQTPCDRNDQFFMDI